jgi:hypothetical protein
MALAATLEVEGVWSAGADHLINFRGRRKPSITLTPQATTSASRQEYYIQSDPYVLIQR